MSDPWAFGWDQIAAFLNAIVIGVATWVAWRSVHDWREERLDARRAEVAEQALILAHQAIPAYPNHRWLRRRRIFAHTGANRITRGDAATQHRLRADRAHSEGSPIFRASGRD
jgi:hypothetical protein